MFPWLISNHALSRLTASVSVCALLTHCRIKEHPFSTSHCQTVHALLSPDVTQSHSLTPFFCPYVPSHALQTCLNHPDALILLGAFTTYESPSAPLLQWKVSLAKNPPCLKQKISLKYRSFVSAVIIKNCPVLIPALIYSQYANTEHLILLKPYRVRIFNQTLCYHPKRQLVKLSSDNDCWLKCF